MTGPRGDFNQWDFIKNFINMFNLVLTVDEENPTTIVIEPYNDWVDSGTTHYWDRKLDTQEIVLAPIEGLSKDIRFMHEEDADDWITTAHENPNLWKYSHLFESFDEIYDSVEEEVTLPGFSATYCKQHFGTDMYAPQIMNNDGSAHWENNMRIMYDNGVRTSADGWNGALEQPQGQNLFYDYLLFTMVDAFPPIPATSLSYNFGVVNYSGPGGPVLHGLFNEYWAKYMDELYHKDTRIATVNMMLTAADIHKFKFNDIVHLQGKIWRIKLIEYSGETSSVVELITVKDL